LRGRVEGWKLDLSKENLELRRKDCAIAVCSCRKRVTRSAALQGSFAFSRNVSHLSPGIPGRSWYQLPPMFPATSAPEIVENLARVKSMTQPGRKDVISNYRRIGIFYAGSRGPSREFSIASSAGCIDRSTTESARDTRGEGIPRPRDGRELVRESLANETSNERTGARKCGARAARRVASTRVPNSKMYLKTHAKLHYIVGIVFCDRKSLR